MASAMVQHQGRQVVGVVVSAGKMMKTVKVQIPKQKWNKRIQKNYPIPYNVLVSDPTESTREGDVVSIQSGLRTSPKVNHVVSDIIAPMGPPLSQRPRLPTPEERMAAMIARKEARDEQQAKNGRVVAMERVRVREAERAREEKRARAERRGVEERERVKERAGRTELEGRLKEVREKEEIKRAARKADGQDPVEKTLVGVFNRTIKYWGKDYSSQSTLDETKPVEQTRKKSSTHPLLKERLESYFQQHEQVRDRHIDIISAQDKLDQLRTEIKAERRRESPRLLELYLAIAHTHLEIASQTALTLDSLVQDNNLPSFDPSHQNQNQDLNSNLFNESTIQDLKIPSLIYTSIQQELSSRQVKYDNLKTYVDTIKGREVEFAKDSLKWDILVRELDLSDKVKRAASKELGYVEGVEKFGRHVIWGDVAKAKVRKQGEKKAGAVVKGVAAKISDGVDAAVKEVVAPVSEKLDEEPASNDRNTQTEKKGETGDKKGIEKGDKKGGVLGWLGL